MRTRSCISGLVAAALLAAPGGLARAQPAAPAPTPANAAPNAQDLQFVQALGADGAAEVDAASLAGARAQDPQVRAYAQQVARERGAANAQLAAIAQQAGIPMAAGARQGKRQRLDSSGWQQFDRAYVNGEAADHQRTIQLLSTEMNEGRSPQLRSYAATTMGMVMQHLAQARALETRTAGRGGL
jgi:putative membrane protein